MARLNHTSVRDSAQTECDRGVFVAPSGIRGIRLFHDRLAAIAVVVMLLAAAPVYADEFDRYSCFPRYEVPVCGPRVSEMSQDAQTFYTLLSECGGMLNDKTAMQKFVLATSLVIAWTPPGAALAKQAWSDMPYDVAECMVHGLTESSFMHPEEKKAAHDLVSMIGKLRDTASDAADATAWAKGVRSERLARAWEAYELGLHRQDIAEIPGLWDSAARLYPASEAFGSLEQAGQLSLQCEFPSARKELDRAKSALKQYCEWAGYSFRREQRLAECYYEWHAETISYGTEYQARRFHALSNSVQLKRESISRNLGKFEEIENMGRLIEERDDFFTRRRQEYEATKMVAERALSEQDLKTACSAVLGLRTSREKAREGYIDCPDRVAPDLEMLEETLMSLRQRKTVGVDAALTEAETAIGRGASEEAKRHLDFANRELPRLVALGGNACVPPLEEPQLRNRYEQLLRSLDALSDTSRNPCEDLSGTWYHETSDIGCNSTWSLVKVGPNRYDANEYGCGNARGAEAWLEGNRLTIRWKVNANCHGDYRWTLNGDCSAGSGTVAFTSDKEPCTGSRTTKRAWR